MIAKEQDQIDEYVALVLRAEKHLKDNKIYVSGFGMNQVACTYADFALQEIDRAKKEMEELKGRQ